MYCYSCMNEIKDGHICSNCHNASANELLPHHLRPGQVLNGKYLVGNCIGEGGFGITYIGRDLVLDIKVAIKEFFPNGCVNRNNSATQDVTATTQEQKDFFNKGKLRFLEEAKNIAKFIDEPGVVSVREYFEANSTAYIIMEYLDGENLSRYVRKNGRMPAQEVFTLMLPIMKSLHRIHEAGIIHRDISPDNIMYMKNGTLKLMDFGSARFFTNEEKEMSIMLKKGYAPEEQYRKNGHQGPWTDVYGLCATIYRCITGVVPLDALDRMHEDRLKKPSQLGIQISPALEAVLMFGLAVYHDNRYKNMKELQTNIAKAIKLQPSIPPSDVTRSYNKNSNQYHTYNKTIRADEQTYGDGFISENKQKQFTPEINHNNYRDIFQTPSAQKEKSKAGTTAIIIMLVFLLVAVGGVCLYLYLDKTADSDKNEYAKSTQTITAEPETESSTQSPTEEPTQIETKVIVSVPNVVDLKYTQAETSIKDADLKVDFVWTSSTSVDYGYVISQSPTSEKDVEEGSKIIVYVSKTQQIDPNRLMYSCASDTLTLRESASRSSKSLDTIKSREKMEYISTSGEFYCVKYKDKTGYVLSEFVSTDPNAPLNTGSGNVKPTEPPVSYNNIYDTTTYYCRATSHVTLREEPSVKSKKVDTVYKDDTVDYISTSGDFFFVEYDGQYGYVLKKFFSTNPKAPLLDDPV